MPEYPQVDDRMLFRQLPDHKSGETDYGDLRVDRRDVAKLIWKLASPKWNFDDATFDRSAAAFDNPDHVAVVIHIYRWRLALADGEAKYADLEKRLAEFPVITVPTITLESDANGAPHPDPAAYAKKFSGKYEHRTVTGGIGHNLAQEAPQAFAQAVVDVAKFFMDFIQRESCGKCIPCREGTRRMLEILQGLTRSRRGESEMESLERFRSVMNLEHLARVIRDTSLCALGGSAPNPVLKLEVEEEVLGHLLAPPLGSIGGPIHGEELDGKIEIKSGLAAGEMVVADGALFLGNRCI